MGRTPNVHTEKRLSDCVAMAGGLGGRSARIPEVQFGTLPFTCIPGLPCHFVLLAAVIMTPEQQGVFEDILARP